MSKRAVETGLASPGLGSASLLPSAPAQFKTIKAVETDFSTRCCQAKPLDVATMLTERFPAFFFWPFFGGALGWPSLPSPPLLPAPLPPGFPWASVSPSD